MRKVMAFGTFDLLHQGHIRFLREASSFGDLIAVVARDSNVTRIKGRSPVQDQIERRKAVASLPYVKKALIGGKDGLLRIVDRLQPDIICLGYDQDDQGLNSHLDAMNMDTKVIRLKPYRPEVYKSSVLRDSLP